MDIPGLTLHTRSCQDSISGHDVTNIDNAQEVGQPYLEPIPVLATPHPLENPTHLYMEVLNEISEEVRFAVKCLERAAGEETIKATLTNISKLANAALENNGRVMGVYAGSTSLTVLSHNPSADSGGGVSDTVGGFSLFAKSISHQPVPIATTPLIPVILMQHGPQARPQPSGEPATIESVPPSPSAVAAETSQQMDMRNAMSVPKVERSESAKRRTNNEPNPSGFGNTDSDNLKDYRDMRPRYPHSRDASRRREYSRGGERRTSPVRRESPGPYPRPSSYYRSSDWIGSARLESYRLSGLRTDETSRNEYSRGRESENFRGSIRTRSYSPPRGPRGLLRGPDESSHTSRGDPPGPMNSASRPTESRPPEPSHLDVGVSSAYTILSHPTSSCQAPPNAPTGPASRPLHRLSHPTNPLAERIGLSEKLETRLAIESTLRVQPTKSYTFTSLNMPDLLAALRLPNLLHLQIYNNALYLRLANPSSAQKVASSYKNFKKGTINPVHETVLDMIKVSHPADYAPVVPNEVIDMYRDGKRRRLCTSSFVRREHMTEYQQFEVAVKQLWGFFSFCRISYNGRVYIGFEGVEAAVAGKGYLERKFPEVVLTFAEERNDA